MRRCLFLSFLAFGLVACDGGEGDACLLDSDCADFSQVCLEGICRAAGELPDGGGTDGSTPRDSGPGEDSGPEMDSGPGDSGPPDEGGMSDAGGDEAGMMDCADVTGDWRISAVNAAGPCGDAMVDYGVTITADTMACDYIAVSADSGEPALDGTFALDPLNAVLGMLATGTAAAVTCNGNFSTAGEQFTFICGACVMNLVRATP